jgi:hypothetical protein
MVRQSMQVLMNTVSERPADPGNARKVMLGCRHKPLEPPERGQENPPPLGSKPRNLLQKRL